MISLLLDFLARLRGQPTRRDAQRMIIACVDMAQCIENGERWDDISVWDVVYAANGAPFWHRLARRRR